MNMDEIWKYDLRKGNTDHPRNGACLFDAGMWLVYGKIGDSPPCSCPVIRAYAVRLNDSMPDAKRQRLKPFILRVVGNRDPDAVEARRRYIVLETARRIVPLAYERKWPGLAIEMRALPDDASDEQFREVMAKARDAAAYEAAAAAAYDAYDAAAYEAAAAAAAYDAAAAHAAAAHAAYAAAYAAYAAAYAAYDAAASNRVWDEAIVILDGVLRIGKQSPEFDEAEVRASVAAFDVARLAHA